MIRDVRIVSSRFGLANSHRLSTVLMRGAYDSLPIHLKRPPEQIVRAVDESGLRGKGGGGAPAGEKWKLMPRNSDTPSYLVVNCDESEPGTFKDREIITRDPHLLIEGMILTSYAIGANHAYIYIRGEYKSFELILRRAVDEAYEAGFLGRDIAGSGFDLDITIHRGGGAYICGEKSALLESLEGKRGHPRLKPKGKEPEWYFGAPALVNNVETIASVPYIVMNGARCYRQFGTAQSPGTLLFSLSGHIERPGIYEAEFGVSMMEYIERFGGGVKGKKKLKGVIPGGISTPILTAEEAARATLDYESLRTLGSSLGTGGMIVLSSEADMHGVLKNILGFYRHESCGQCTPCREGTSWSDQIASRMLRGEATMKDLDKLLELADTMNGKTICVFAPAVSGVILSIIDKFRDEFTERLRP